MEVLGEEDEADLENSVLVRLINDKFGNYVVQKCFDAVEQFQQDEGGGEASSK